MTKNPSLLSERTRLDLFVSEALAAQIREIRNRRCFSQRQAAELIGCKRSHVSRFESAKHAMTLPTFIVIVRALAADEKVELVLAMERLQRYEAAL